MKKHLLYILLAATIFFSYCNTIEEKGVTYTLIRDNLYSDENGNLYLKFVNNEDIENGKTHNVWLSTAYCDVCKPPKEKENIALKDIVDISTFHRDGYLEDEDVVIYADKKYRYRHKPMADGGQISLEEK